MLKVLMDTIRQNIRKFPKFPDPSQHMLNLSEQMVGGCINEKTTVR